MSAELPPRAVELLDSDNLVVLTTLNADGSPHSTPVWALREGNDIVVSTLRERKKARNLDQDARVAVVVLDPDNPASYFSMSGAVTVTVDEEKKLLDRLSVKYLGEPYPVNEDPHRTRLVVRLTPQKVIAQYEPAT